MKKIWVQIKGAYKKSYQNNRFHPTYKYHNLLNFLHRQLLQDDEEFIKNMQIDVNIPENVENNN